MKLREKILLLIKQYRCPHSLTIETNTKKDGNSRTVSIKKYCHRCEKDFPNTTQDWRIEGLERTVDHLSGVAENLTDLLKLKSDANPETPHKYPTPDSDSDLDKQK